MYPAPSQLSVIDQPKNDSQIRIHILAYSKSAFLWMTIINFVGWLDCVKYYTVDWIMAAWCIAYLHCVCTFFHRTDPFCLFQKHFRFLHLDIQVIILYYVPGYNIEPQPKRTGIKLLGLKSIDPFVVSLLYPVSIMATLVTRYFALPILLVF